MLLCCSHYYILFHCMQYTYTADEVMGGKPLTQHQCRQQHYSYALRYIVYEHVREFIIVVVGPTIQLIQTSYVLRYLVQPYGPTCLGLKQ